MLERVFPALVVLSILSVSTGLVRATADEPAFGGSGLDAGTPGAAAWPLASPCSFTQNLDFEIEPGGSLACVGSGGTTDNQFLRVFDLDVEHGFGGQVCLDSLDYAVESSVGDVDLTFYVYCTRQGLADDAIYGGINRAQDLDPGLVFSVSAVQPDAELEFFNQPLGGCCDADSQDLAVEIAAEDCAEDGTCYVFFPGADGYGSTKPYYISAPDCGIDDPVNADAITGLGVHELLMQVNATCDEAGDGGDDPDVPAAGGWGLGLLLVTVLATGAYFVRRGARA